MRWTLTLTLTLTLTGCPGPARTEYWIAPGASEATLVLSGQPPNPF